MKDSYCELHRGTSSQLELLTGFNRDAQSRLLSKIKDAINIIQTALPGQGKSEINCSHRRVSFK